MCEIILVTNFIVCVCLPAVLAIPKGYLIKLRLEYALSTILNPTLPVVEILGGLGVIVQGKKLFLPNYWCISIVFYSLSHFTCYWQSNNKTRGIHILCYSLLSACSMLFWL